MRSLCTSVIFTALLLVLPVGCVKKQSAPAIINKTIIITETELRGEAADDLESIELRKLRDKASYASAEHEAMTKALDRLLEEKLLTLESAEQGISKEELIDREIRGKIVEPSEEEIDYVYELNRTRGNLPPKEAIAEQISEFLRNMSEKKLLSDFVGELEQKYNVVRNLKPLRFDVKADGRPSIGPNTAPVKLVLFSDFECPYCHDFRFTLMEVTKRYGDKVQLIFRNLPIVSLHENAQRAAEASLCARDQKRFWETHDILFENQRNLTEKNILALMQTLDIDMEKFSECLASGRHKSEIQEDIRAAAAAGIDGTAPTLFINGIHLSGNQPYEAVADIINKELGSN